MRRWRGYAGNLQRIVHPLKYMPGWSMPLFRVRGILISLHFTFFLFVGYFAWEGWRAASWQGLAWTLGFVLMLFVCITLHEFGHALTALHFKIQVPRILLTPIGGIAELASLPEQPAKEMAVIAAGPAVNFAIVLVLMPWVALPSPLFIASGYIPLTLTGFVQEILRFNLIMGLFNLLPVFPMDGGRLLRAALATRHSYLKATGVAVRVGQTLAVIFAAGFLLSPKPNLLASLLFLFIFFAATVEYRWLRSQHAFRVRITHYADRLLSPSSAASASSESARLPS